MGEMALKVRNTKNAMAFLVAILSPFIFVMVYLSILCFFGAGRMPITLAEKIIFPVFDFFAVFAVWWSYKNGGFNN